MKHATFYTLGALLIASSSALAQPFATTEYIDVNNIKAAVALHGDMNWLPATQTSACEFPKGSGKHLGILTSLWMSGIDEQLQLKTAAQTYRQTGTDYWPGPLTNGSLDMATSTKWARIWKVSFTDINNHIANTTHTLANTPAAILEWPAKGNPNAKGNAGASLTIATDMAPFVDVNADGSYNALDGDYPLLKGDQMLWWVFSDNGPTHNNTNSQALQVEVHATAYAYNRGTLLNNIIYYEMNINKRSRLNLSNFRAGLFADMDLGYYNDDYIGFDSSRRLGYVYNAKAVDGAGQTNAYGDVPPIAGYTVLSMPGDVGSTIQPAGSFMTYNNDNTASGNPVTAVEYDHYLRSRFRDGQHLHNDRVAYGVISTGRGAGPDANYLYPGNPSDTAGWSECSAKNPWGDRRFVLSSGDFNLPKGTSATVIFALVTTDTAKGHVCGEMSITPLTDVTDTAWKNYKNPPKTFVSVGEITAAHKLGVYPNPANDILSVETGAKVSKDAQIAVYDVTGKRMDISYYIIDKQIRINVAGLIQGVYNVLYIDGQVHKSAVFIKE